MATSSAMTLSRFSRSRICLSINPAASAFVRSWIVLLVLTTTSWCLHVVDPHRRLLRSDLSEESITSINFIVSNLRTSRVRMWRVEVGRGRFNRLPGYMVISSSSFRLCDGSGCHCAILICVRGSAMLLLSLFSVWSAVPSPIGVSPGTNSSLIYSRRYTID
jgi:hypothetical protein